MDEWKKTLSQIEKEHNREAKKARGELKHALTEANRLKRKLSKQANGGIFHSRQNSGGSTIGQGVGLGEPPTSSRLPATTVSSGIGTSSLAVRTESALKVLEEKILRIEDLERTSIRKLMLEERERYCFFFNCIRPVLVSVFWDIMLFFIYLYNIVEWFKIILKYEVRTFCSDFWQRFSSFIVLVLIIIIFM